MTGHIKAWKSEYKSWKGGRYSPGLLNSLDRRGRLLDAGCGSGKYAIPLAMRGFDVIGLDVSLNALKMARGRADNRKLKIEFMTGNVYHLPFSDCSFDVIWCYGVLQHLLLKERELAISEFRRILNEDGILFIEVLGKEDMRYGGDEIEPDSFVRKNGIIYHYFNKMELGELLKSKNFSCEITESRNEKRFYGSSYMRHMISAVAKKD
ncbi:MAG: class I SAM-dependent methyltransferase [Candidatus Methanoperedens sp.]